MNWPCRCAPGIVMAGLNSALKITLSPPLLTPDYQQAMLKEFRTVFNVQ